MKVLLLNTYQILKWIKMNIEQIIKENQVTIVDVVRSYAEFMGGNVMGSINIALNEIPDRIEELKNLKAPLILCCTSGNRSRQAQHFLSQHAIECYNGGSWLDVNYYQSLKTK
jgi:phage shock protein E